MSRVDLVLFFLSVELGVTAGRGERHKNNPIHGSLKVFILLRSRWSVPQIVLPFDRVGGVELFETQQYDHLVLSEGGREGGGGVYKTSRWFLLFDSVVRFYLVTNSRLFSFFF